MKKVLRTVKYRMHLMKHHYLDGFIYIHINKTAGTSITKALNLPFEHETALEKIEAIGRDTWEQKLTFTVVRNPWDRAVSHYHWRIVMNHSNLRDKHIPFAEWVKRVYRDRDPYHYTSSKMFMPQIDWISDDNGRILVNEILLFENLDCDFSRLLQKLGINGTLPHAKKLTVQTTVITIIQRQLK